MICSDRDGVHFDAGYGLESVSGHNRPHSASESRRAKSRTIADSAGSVTVSGFGQTVNPYDELGVTTVINCEGTMTMLGGRFFGRRSRHGYGRSPFPKHP